MNTKVFSKRSPLSPSVNNIDTELVYSSHEMSSSNVLLTIAIPTFRRPALLAEALKSCRQQSCRDFHVVVVDNDSTAEFSERVNDVICSANLPNISLYRNKSNVGMFGNWNKCFTLPTTPYVCILNDDDLLAADYVKCILELLAECPEADMLQTGYDILDQRFRQNTLKIDRWDGINVGAKSTIRALSFRKLCVANRRSGCTGITYRIGFARGIGGFDPDDYPTSDYFFNVRMLANGAKGYEVRRRLSVYRVAENESLKAETLLGFVVNEYRLRHESAYLFRFPTLMKFYAHLAVSTQRRSLRQMWLIDLSSAELERLVGLRPIESPFFLLFYRIINVICRQIVLI